MNKRPSIAVIGAGLSGLACATELQTAGWQVSVFEKSRGPAGRMSTRRGDDWQCDHGAQYFTARDPRFQAEVARWQAAGVAALWQPRLAVIGDEHLHDPDAARPRFVGTPRMSAPARFLADSLALTVQCTVNEIARSAAGWHISSAEHGRLAEVFDALVLAVPAPQAIPLLQTVAPDFAGIARQAVMRACWTLMLRYPATVDLPFDAAFVNRGPLRWVAREQSKPGRPAAETWLLHASATWSEAHVEADPDWVASRLLAAFTELGAPPPAAWSAHRWRYADTEPPLNLGYCRDAGLGLGLCGDWLNGGKVEGAWLSGFQLAQSLIRGA
jgi:renalase